MESDLDSSKGRISIDIDSDEIPEIMIVPGYRKSQNVSEDYLDSDWPYRSSVNDLKTKISQQAETIKRLLFENEMILKEREEVLEEYDDELKATKMQNEDLIRSNREMKQEIKILYNQLEVSNAKREKFDALHSKTRSLEKSIEFSTKMIEDLRETNEMLVRNLPQSEREKQIVVDNSANNVIEELINEKNLLMKRVVELDSKFLDSVKEIEELKNELVACKMDYAQAETEKGEIYKKCMEKQKVKRFSWTFWRFWRRG